MIYLNNYFIAYNGCILKQYLTSHPRFRDALATISGKIKLRNAGRRHSYTYLDSENLPNAISI